VRLIAVVIILVVFVTSNSPVVVCGSTVVSTIIWRTPVIAVIAARVVSIISRISVAVPVSGVTESDSDWSDPD
jgi:hypothetical protein